MDGNYYKYEQERQKVQQLEYALKQKDRKIRSLERQVHDWTKVFQELPYLMRRWALWRYSKLN